MRAEKLPDFYAVETGIVPLRGFGFDLFKCISVAHLTNFVSKL